MTSRSKYAEEAERRRRRNSQAATRVFMEWAHGPGAVEIPVTLEARMMAMLLAVTTHHAAELASEGGDPTLLALIGELLGAYLREALGQDELCRVLDLLTTMITGLE